MRKNKCNGATGMHKILSLLGGEVTLSSSAHCVILLQCSFTLASVSQRVCTRPCTYN